VSLLVATFPPPAYAFVYTSWKCAPAGCKYAQGRAYYSPGANYLSQSQWRGGTASQSCDPTNDVIKWRLAESSLFEYAPEWRTTWVYGPTSWKYYCNVYFITYGVVVGEFYGTRADLWQEFYHDASCSGCDFISTIRTPLS